MPRIESSTSLLQGGPERSTSPRIDGNEVCRVDVPASSCPIWANDKEARRPTTPRRSNSTGDPAAEDAADYIADRFRDVPTRVSCPTTHLVEASIWSCEGWTSVMPHPHSRYPTLIRLGSAVKERLAPAEPSRCRRSGWRGRVRAR